MKMTKKGQLGSNAIMTLGSIAIAIVAVGVILSSGAEVQADIQGDQVVGSMAYNITATGLENTQKVSDKSSLVVTISIAVLIIAIIVSGFGVAGMMQR